METELSLQTSLCAFCLVPIYLFGILQRLEGPHFCEVYQSVVSSTDESFNLFKTDKTAANDNLRLCLKWKPQEKCH